MKCLNCGNELAAGTRFCNECGVKVEYADNNQNDQVKDQRNTYTASEGENTGVNNTDNHIYRSQEKAI